MRSLAVLGLFLFILFFSSVTREEPAPSGLADPEIREFVQELRTWRRKIGCPDLKWDDRLAAVAQKHSQDMVSRKFFSHTNPDGEDTIDRLEKAHIFFLAFAENIASGAGTGKVAFQTWLNSPPHRENMLDCQYLRQGVGRVDGKWTQDLVSP